MLRLLSYMHYNSCTGCGNGERGTKRINMNESRRGARKYENTSHIFSFSFAGIFPRPIFFFTRTAYCHSPITFPLHKIMQTIIISCARVGGLFATIFTHTHTRDKATKRTKCENGIILSRAMESKSSQM